MKKFYCLLLALSFVSSLSVNAQDAPHSGEDTPLNKEESQETAATQEELAEFAALAEAAEEIDPEEKAKANSSETEKKTACINISPSEQKANDKEQSKKIKPNTNTVKEKVNKSPKCSKLKPKEAEATKKKPKASSRVKLVSYRPGVY